MANFYSTNTTIFTNMVGVTNDTSSAALVNNMIKEAEAEINKWVSKRYDISAYQTTTASTTTGGAPPLLQAWCNRLSEGYAWIRLSRGSDERIAIGKELVEDVKECLKALANNEVDLVDVSGALLTELDNPMPVLSNTNDRFSTFDEDDPLNWTVDPDKLDDINSGRS